MGLSLKRILLDPAGHFIKDDEEEAGPSGLPDIAGILGGISQQTVESEQERTRKGLAADTSSTREYLGTAIQESSVQDYVDRQKPQTVEQQEVSSIAEPAKKTKLGGLYASR